MTLRPYVNRTAVGAANRLNSRRFIRRTKRRNRKFALYRSIGFTSDRPIIDALVRSYGRGNLVPKNITRISLQNFSFLDSPDETIANIAAIAAAHESETKFHLDFPDKVCLDITPYMVVGLMRQEMRISRCAGGTITEELKTILSAASMRRFLRMNYLETASRETIQPFEMVYQPPILDISSRSIFQRSRKEKTATQLTQKIDQWLSASGFQLTDSYANQIKTMVNEILDNSRHASSSGPLSDSAWTVTGFMSRRARADGSLQLFCHIGFISIGRSFAQSLRTAAKPLVKDLINAYVSLHHGSSDLQDDDALMTSMAFTDSITCTKGGGCGLSKMVDVISTLGATNRVGEQPAMVVVSGQSCVRLVTPFNRMLRASTGKLYQHFNDIQEATLLPATEHVYKLRFNFPGTIVAIRFVLDQQNLLELAERTAA